VQVFTRAGDIVSVAVKEIGTFFNLLAEEET